MNSNSKYMFVLGLSLIMLFAVSIGNFNLSKVATDSGFDTSYSGGGSSSSSSSSDFGDSSGGGDGDLFGWFENISVGLFFMIVPIIGFIHDKGIKNKIKWILASIALVVLILLRILVLLIILPLFGILLASLPSLITSSFKKKPKIKKGNYLPKTDANLAILKEGYNIFLNVQEAWMNFDYDKLREETTDNLYNMYYNQLQTLSVKGQKNIMSDFDLINYELVKLNKKENLVTVKMLLEVKFYDYIVDQNGKVVRGKKKRKVHMLYDLTYVYDENAIKKCPNCDAELNAKDTICNYCKTNIVGVRSKMKLSTKKCISQK